MHSGSIRPWWIVLALQLAVAPAHASFTDIGAGLTGVRSPAVAWGDYDADGDLDLVVMGSSISGASARLYENVGGAFADSSALPVSAAVTNGALAWGDYDNDGDLDLALSGTTTPVSPFIPLTRIYRNTGGVLTDIGAPLAGVYNSAIAWVDFDNDGDLDLASAGATTTASPATHIYRNTAGSFADTAVVLAGLDRCAMAWGDYDNDGDHDLVFAGLNGTVRSTNLYANSAGSFTLVNSGLQAVDVGSLAWSDYDSDGDLDLLVSGGTPIPVSRVYRNTAAEFTDSGVVVQGIQFGAVVWGDYDNDGASDIAMCGGTGSVGFAAVYRNENGAMRDISAGIASTFTGDLAWGDYDNDADLDLALAGNANTGPTSVLARIYRNTGVPSNTPPIPPSGLFATVDSMNVTFHWNAANDAQQLPRALSYNLWAGNAPGTPDVMAPMANLANGHRSVAQLGNAGENLQWTIRRHAFSGPRVYWGVQAIDQGFMGSSFATGPLALLDVAPPSVVEPTLRLLGANPTRSEARLVYSLPRASHVNLVVLDIAGRTIRTLVQGDRAAGEHEARWNGESASGARCAPGLYLVRLTAGGMATSLRILRVE